MDPLIGNLLALRTVTPSLAPPRMLAWVRDSDTFVRAPKAGA